MDLYSTPAIILGGRIMGLTAIRALGKRGVNVNLIYHDVNDYAVGSKYVKRSILGPHPEKNESDFVQFILGLKNDLNGAIIYPSEDEYLTIIAKHKETFSKHFIIACNDLEVISKLINKKYVYDISQNAGVPTPKNLVTKDRLLASNFAKRIGYPCLVKPSQSHIYYKAFGKKMAKVDNEKSLLYELENAIALNLDVMIQEFIPGTDDTNFSYWGYKCGNKFYAEATAQKVRNDPPGTGSPRVQITRNIPDIIPLARKVLEALNYEGYANVEFKLDKNSGGYKFMEVNPRINRCMLQAIAGGIDYPKIIYNHLVNGILPGNLSCEEGIYWIDLAKDIIRNFQFRKIEHYNLSDYLSPYFHKHVFAVFSLSDPKPFIKRSLSFITH